MEDSNIPFHDLGISQRDFLAQFLEPKQYAQKRPKTTSFHFQGDFIAGNILSYIDGNFIASQFIIIVGGGGGGYLLREFFNMRYF